MDRRDFLVGHLGAALLAAWPADLLAQAGAAPARPAAAGAWDAGRLRHLLPTVSDTRILIKASFVEPLKAAPTLRVGTAAVRGRMSDTTGECWRFHAAGLAPGRSYALSLTAANGRALCQPWNLKTFPPADASPERFRVLFFTCAGGPESESLTRGYLPTTVRNRLLRRGLSFSPDAAVANGDHVYWDLHQPRVPPAERDNTRLSSFARSALVFGDRNETVLKLAAGPQIVPVYGADFRSTPVYFLQDDHDYFDNDEATPEMTTFPAPWFQLQLARATQLLYYPEFLPDSTRPDGLPWSLAGDRTEQLSESFGTLRFGGLAEVLLYDVRRTMTLAGPGAVMIDPVVEQWLQTRTALSDAAHLVHAPSNPPGWSAGKWGEWYPDVLDSKGRLTTAQAKPYWQTGWLDQHDRIMGQLVGRRDRIPLIVSGDLHAVALGRIRRAGKMDLSAHPITSLLSGPIGTRPEGWPSAFRGVAPTPPAHLDLEEQVKPIEQHGFILADFLADRIVLRLFKWDVKTEPVEAIDRLEPFHVTELQRPA
jgi:hypothetical protein